MRVYDSKGRLTVDFKLHASKHESGGTDEVSLAASQITSGRFGVARMPDGTSGQVLTAQGAGVNPAYAAITVSELATAGDILGNNEILSYFRKYTGVHAYTASDNLLKSDDAEVSHSTSTYTKYKTITVPAGLSSSQSRIKFDLRAGGAGFNSAARIYKNGVAFGTEQSTASQTYVTKSEDLSGFVGGDTIELWLRCVYGAPEYARNFRVYGTWFAEILELAASKPSEPSW